MKWFSTACPRNCYSTCSFMVCVSDEGKIVEIKPHPSNRATPEGVCLKGLSYLERANSVDRITFPLQKKEGKFVEISYEDALSEISKKMIQFKENYGAQSILFYAASGMSGLLNKFSYKFWEMFGGATTTYGNLCWPAGLEATRLTLGANKHNAPWDLENARLIILWGKNPAETNVQQMIPIEKAQKKGATLIVVDPRRTNSAQRAQMLIQPTPGTDALIALAVAKIIIRNQQHDNTFVTNYVKGFKAFADSLQSIDIQQVCNISKVPFLSIVKLAELIGTTKPMTIVPGYGMQRFSNGGQTIRCILALQIITGNIGKQGACWHYANLQSYIFDAVKEPLSYYPTNNESVFRRTISMAKLGYDMLAQTDPPLKMVWVERGNPLNQNPETQIIRKAFRNLEFRVVVEQFMTDTAQEADIILPAKNMFEQSDIIGSYWNPYIQLKQKVCKPAGAVLPETEIYFRLAQTMGFKNSEIEKNLLPPGDAAVDNYLKKQLEKYSKITLEELKQNPVEAPDYEEIAFADLKFDTPSGKIEFQSEQAEILWQMPQIPTYSPVNKNKNTENFPLWLLSPNSKNKIHSQFHNLKVIRMLENKPYVLMNFYDAYTRKIRNNSSVRVFNHSGELFINVKISYEIKQGCVCIHNGWWATDGANVNELSTALMTDMGYGTAFHDNKVEVENLTLKK